MSLLFILIVAISSVSSLILSMIFGNLNIWISIFSLLLGLSLGLFFSKDQIDLRIQNLSQKTFFILFFGLLSFQFTHLLYQVRMEDVWYATLNPNNRGDLPFHINMIKAFARGLSFWPDHPFILGERLRYPFGINLFNAQWDILGVPLEKHLMIVGLLSLAALMSELYRWLGIWGILCFFLSGGLGSFLPDSDLEFKNLYLSVFVTQRGFLWALPAGIWLIRNFKTKNYLWIFIFAVMPFFHLHSFVFLAVYFLGLSILQNGFKFPKELVIAGILGSPWILQAIFPPQSMQVIHFSTYWWQWKNWGAWGVLCIATLFLMQKRKALGPEHFLAVVLTLVFSVVILAPWDWDQIKVLIWCYLLLNAMIAETLLKLISKKGIWVLAVVVFFPGALQMWKSLPKNQFAKDRVYLAKVSDVQNVREALKNFDPNEALLVAPVYNHPVFFAGQSVVMGYPGHAWSQATDASALLQFIEDSVSSGRVDENSPYGKQIKWILSSPFEKEKWPSSQLFLHEDWSLFCVKPGQCP